jgi:hypothetical protein
MIVVIITLGIFILSCLLGAYISIGAIIFRKDLEKSDADIISIMLLWPYYLWIKKGKKTRRHWMH